MQYGTYNFARERLAESHREAVLIAVSRRGRSRSGEISDYINQTLNIKITKRAVQDWLSKLRKEGYVGRDKYNCYQLTERGKDLRLFAEFCGKLNLKNLMKLPLPELREQVLEEMMRRFGFLLIWHFVYVTMGESTPKNKAEEDSLLTSWIQSSIPIGEMYNEFMKIFGKKIKGRYFPYTADDKTRGDLLWLLVKNHTEYSTATMSSLTEIVNELFKEPNLRRDKNIQEILEQYRPDWAKQDISES